MERAVLVEKCHRAAAAGASRQPDHDRVVFASSGLKEEVEHPARRMNEDSMSAQQSSGSESKPEINCVGLLCRPTYQHIINLWHTTDKQPRLYKEKQAARVS